MSNCVDTVLNLIRPFFNEAQAHVDSMKVGEKVPATELAKKIAERHGMTGPQLYPTLKFFFDNCPEIEVRRGAHGGLFKVVPKTNAAPQVETVVEVVAESLQQQ